MKRKPPKSPINWRRRRHMILLAVFLLAAAGLALAVAWMIYLAIRNGDVGL